MVRFEAFRNQDVSCRISRESRVNLYTALGQLLVTKVLLLTSNAILLSWLNAPRYYIEYLNTHDEWTIWHVAWLLSMSMINKWHKPKMVLAWNWLLHTIFVEFILSCF